MTRTSPPIKDHYAMKGLAYYTSPVGDLVIESDDDKIITPEFSERHKN